MTQHSATYGPVTDSRRPRHRIDPCETRHEYAEFLTLPDPGSVTLTCCTFCGIQPNGHWLAPGFFYSATWPNYRLRPKE